MRYVVKYHSSVEEEVKEIVDWYNEKALSISINFLSQLRLAENLVLKSPFAYRIVSNKGIRRVVVKKFPYKVYFRVEEKTIYILAVIHFARSNSYIRKRLKK